MTDEMTKTNKEKKRSELYALYYQRDKEFESAKLKRMIITLLGFTAFYFWLFFQLRSPDGWDILLNLVSALITAGFHIYVNLLVFGYLTIKGHEESEALAVIKKAISNLDNQESPITQPPLQSLTKRELAALISREIWEHTFHIAKGTDFAENPLDASCVWSALLYSVRDILDKHDLTYYVNWSFSNAAASMYATPADSDSPLNALSAQRFACLNALDNAQCDFYSDDGIRDILLLLRSLSVHAVTEKTHLPVSQEDVNIFKGEMSMLEHAIQSLVVLQK